MGVRGIIPATILVEVEKITKKPISDLFQFIGGTSTGGILALGLAMPKEDSTPKFSARDLLHLYTDPSIAIGCKNWLFLGSERSGEAIATLLSLVQTCRALNINPRAYLENICRRIMGYYTSKLYELLPDEWAKAR